MHQKFESAININSKLKNEINARVSKILKTIKNSIKKHKEEIEGKSNPYPLCLMSPSRVTSIILDSAYKVAKEEGSRLTIKEIKDKLLTYTQYEIPMTCRDDVSSILEDIKVVINFFYQEKEYYNTIKNHLLYDTIDELINSESQIQQHITSAELLQLPTTGAQKNQPTKPQETYGRIITQLLPGNNMTPSPQVALPTITEYVPPAVDVLPKEPPTKQPLAPKDDWDDFFNFDDENTAIYGFNKNT